jgi:hypothetical protein
MDITDTGLVMKRPNKWIWMLCSFILMMTAGILIHGGPDTCVNGIATVDLKDDENIFFFPLTPFDQATTGR